MASTRGGTRKNNKRDHSAASSSSSSAAAAAAGSGGTSASTSTSASASSNSPKRRNKSNKGKKSSRGNTTPPRGKQQQQHQQQHLYNSTTTTGPSTSTTAYNEQSNQSCLLIALLYQLDALSQSKAKCVAAVQSISKATILHSKATTATASASATSNSTAGAGAATVSSDSMDDVISVVGTGTGTGTTSAIFSAANASKSDTNTATSTTTSTTTTTNDDVTNNSNNNNNNKTTATATIGAEISNESERNANLIIIATHVLNRIMINLAASTKLDDNDNNTNTNAASTTTTNSTSTTDGDGDNTDADVDVDMKDTSASAAAVAAIDGKSNDQDNDDNIDDPPPKKKKRNEKNPQPSTNDDTNDDDNDNDNDKATSTNNDNSHVRQLALVLSIYATTLTKILLADKTQLERTMNAASSRTGGSSSNSNSSNNNNNSSGGRGTTTSAAGAAGRGNTTGGRGGNNKNVDEGGRNPKSVLGRAVLSSILASLKSMHALSKSTLTSTSTSTPPSDAKIYAKVLWRDAIVLERLLALGANYRNIRTSGGSKSGKVATIQSAMLSGGSTAAVLGGIGSGVAVPGDLHGLPGCAAGGSSVTATAAVNSVHNVNMDLRRANVWNELCAAMELEEECKSLEISGGGAKGSSPTSTLPSALLMDAILVEALKESNQKIFLNSEDGDCILKLILFVESSNKGGNDGDKKKSEESSTPPAKRRRTESLTPSAATRTRSRTLSDKNEKKDNVCNEMSALSDKVSEAIFSFDFNKAVLGGNRLTLKKWSSMAFTWVCNGQEIGLETLQNILLTCTKSTVGNNTPSWEDVMKISTVINASSSLGRKKGKNTLAERKKRANATSAKTKGSTINIPGNVVLLTFASRVIDIVNEGGKMAGNSLPRNGTEKYVNLLKNTSLPLSVASSSPSKSPGSSTKTKRTSGRKTRENTSSTTASPASPSVKADVVMSSGGKSKPSSVSNKSNQRKRKDIRNVSIVVMELLCAVHQQCLQENVAKSAIQINAIDDSFELTHFTPKFPLQQNERLRQILLNEDDDAVETGITSLAFDHSKDLLSACRYFPQMHKTIDTLIKCVSSVSSSIGGIEDCATRLTGIAAALAIKCSVVVYKLTGHELKQQKKIRNMERSNANTIVVVDAKFCSFGVEQLSSSVGNITTSSNQPFSDDVDTVVNELTPDVTQRFSLDQPISFRNQIGDTSEYLGLFEGRVDPDLANNVPRDEPNKKNYLHGEILALFLRAMITNAEENDDETSSKIMSMLTETLLRIITCCYSAEVNSINIRRSSFTRFTLAADCIDALRKCFSCISCSKPDKAVESTMLIHGLIRHSSLTPTLVCCFMELGEVLEENIIRQRVDMFGETNELSSHNEKSTSLLSTSNSCHLEFDQWERRLWSSHIKLCLVIGRGGTGFKSSSLCQASMRTKSYLGSYANKLAVFRSITSICENHEQSRARWPLYLPPIHHALITTILISDPPPRTVKDAAPERFICDKLLQSISDALTNPTLILEKARRQKKSNVQVSDEEIPLSFRDSRMLVIALCRLPRKDQQKLLSKLVSMLSSDLNTIKADTELQKLLISEKDFAGFVARVVTVTSIIIDMVSGGKPLLDSLCDQIGPLHYYLPSIIEVDSESDMEESDWYKKESCFMGLWEEWESSALPSVEVSTYSDPLSNDEISKYTSALELALEFGLDSAPEDKCLLLLAAWNASGKLCGIETKSWEGPSGKEDFAENSIPRKLFRIRDDVCNLFREFNIGDKLVPDTFLSKQLQRKEQKYFERITSTGSSKGILQLRCALSSNLDMLKDLLVTSVGPGESTPSSGDFAVLETTVVYTSFLISMFTTSGTEFLSAIIPRDKVLQDRKSKGSSVSADSYDDDASEDSAESEGGYNEFDDDDDDAKSDGISHFHEICEELGAAPIHPDWLDTTCCLRAGIAKSTAVETAEQALRVLTDFGSKVFERYVHSLHSVLCFDDAEKGESGSPFNIINAIMHQKNETTASTTWHDSVGDLYNLDTNIVALFDAGLPCKNISVIKEAWAPNSAHRIRGKLQSSMLINGWAVSGAELRAGAEWEILLSDALLGACSDIDYGQCNPELRKKFHNILRWSRVLHSTVSSIVTATALLRFSLNDGKGRTRHQLNNIDSIQENKDKWFQCSPISRFPSYGDFATLSVSSEQLNLSICKSINFLSDIQSSGALASGCQLSAQAAICHLVGGENDLQVITEVKKIRNLLLGLQALFAYVKGKEMSSSIQSANTIVEKIIQSKQVTSDDKFLVALLFSLGSTILLDISTLHRSGHGLKNILSYDSGNLTTPWQWGQTQNKSIDILVQMMQGRFPIELSRSARLKIIHTVKEMLVAEEKNVHGGEYTISLLKYWNEAKEEDINELILRDICSRDAEMPISGDVNKELSLEISRSLSYIIAFLSRAESREGGKLGVSRYIFEILRKRAESWMMNESLDHVLCLLYFLSVCHGAIGDIGTDVLNYLHSENDSERRLSVLEMFYRFLYDSKKRLQGDMDHDMEEEYDIKKGNTQASMNKNEKSTFMTKSGEIKQRCCTYVTTNGNFCEQHWYNCYTCGLLWDKGCCSLCAQVCHKSKGHDVGYSRKSSFFCDCGAEVGTDCDRGPCKCLSPLSDEILSSVFDRSPYNVANDEGDTYMKINSDALSFWNEVTKISASNFPTFISALDSYFESVHSKIIQKLFEVFNMHFDAWAKKDSILQSLGTNELTGNQYFLGELLVPNNTPSLSNRNGKEVETTQLDERAFSVVRVFKSSTVNAKISNETSTDRLKKTIISKNNIERKIIAADQRGRLIIAEPGSLLFCAGLPLANVRHLSTVGSTQQQRSDLCVLGSSKVKCNIVGLSLSPDDDSRLIAWGTSDAYVFIIAESCDKVETVIELEVGLDLYDCETDYIVKVEWLLGSSGNIIVVFCATSVKIFDVRHSTVAASNDDNEFLCQPMSSYTLAYEDVVIKAGTIIPGGYSTDPNDIDVDSGTKLGILFDTGRVQLIDLNLDCSQSIEDKGEFSIGYGEGLSFPTAGIKRSGSSVEPPGATAKSLGEGTHLEYLHNSQLLLYKCASSPMIAFMLDKSGSITESFEFIPNILSREMLGSGMNGYSITGPYTNWIELGTIQRNGSNFYRASFVGRSTRMNQPKMMYIEFNDETSKVMEVKTSANSLTLGINASVEGTVAFSAPILTQTSNGMIVENSSTFCERIFLASISSNGSMVLFGEDLNGNRKDKVKTADDIVLSEGSKRRRALSDSILTHKKKEMASPVANPVRQDDLKKVLAPLPTFPLTIFEELINMSEKPEVVFGGDSVKDPNITKRRLSMSSGEFIISPCKEGCTLTVSLRSPDGQNKSDSITTNVFKDRVPISHETMDKKDHVEVEKVAIVAVRILLGSTTTDYVPKEISVMGRPITLTQRMKRWYDVPLTDEEIMLGVRSGVVTISIGASYETTKSPPLIDSVEVYAQERSKLPRLFHILGGNDLNFDETEMPQKTVSQSDGESRNSLDTSILAITHICNLVGTKVDLSSQINLQTLRRLIQVTALDSPKDGNVRNHVIDLVKSVEKNTHAMQILLDEGTLQGISNTLRDLYSTNLESSLVSPLKKEKILSKVKDCLIATLLIAKDRPVNYRNSIESLISSGEAKCSIALQAKQILDMFPNRAFTIKTISKLVQLAIFESMATEGSSADKFAGLQLVSEILQCRDESIVKESCVKLAETLKEIQSFDKVQAYQCDGCVAFPITGTRYTLEDKNIDLCKECFERGKKYARAKNFRYGVPVLVNGRQLKMGEDKVMSCSQIRLMTTKLVPTNILEQVREANALREELTAVNEIDDEDNESLKLALKMSLETQAEDNEDSEVPRTSSYNIHMNVMTKLLKDIEQSLSSCAAKENTIRHPIPVIDLLLTLVVQCDSPEDQHVFGKKICDAICLDMFSLVESYSSKHVVPGLQKKIRFAMLVYLRALEGLATKQESILGLMNKSTDKKRIEIRKEVPVVTERSRDKTDPRFICGTHGVPAVRRRCSHGENKDRRFYVCGMDRKSRCDYFKWADENVGNDVRGIVPKVPNSKQSVTSIGSSSDELSVKVDPQLKDLLWGIINDRKQPLQQRLCSLLQAFLKQMDSRGNETAKTGKTNSEDKLSRFLAILEGNKKKAARKKHIDGVHLLSSKLGLLHRHGDLDSQLGCGIHVSTTSASEYSVVEASLDLLSKIAMNALKSAQNPQSSWEGWFAFLCEIISSNTLTHLRSQAKKMMKRLCGGRALYHQIRDQYVFGFQFMKLLLHCEEPLRAALDVREKARRCGSQWRLTDLTWATLPTGGLIGTQELISEDNYAVLKMENVSKILDDLINIARNRGNNWRHFCALDKMPQKNSCKIEIRDRSPICLLLWMACSLPPQNQIKVLKLMEIALCLPCEKESTKSSSSVGEDSIGVMSTDGGTDFEGSPVACDKQNDFCSDKGSPQEVLLGGASGLSVNDIHAFIVSFILNGEDVEVRSLASSVCLRILPSIPKKWVEVLLRRFISILVSDIGYLGCEAIEFLQFLFLLVSDDQIMTDIEVSMLFQATAAFFTQQLKASRDAKLSTGKETTIVQLENDQNDEGQIFDFSNCAHCRRDSCCGNSATLPKNSTGENSPSSGLKNASGGSKIEDKRRKWVMESDGMNKQRLDNCTLNAVSLEFCCHVQLKYRMKITEVHLNVSDPRGRFAKTIGVFFSPRPVRNVNELKHSEYRPLWQRCGTLSLPRGGSRASCKLTCPIVAANLKFEYEEFYEKISSRASGSGAIVIHCPRCTRVVNNAHGGVCGNCGEVAFQCRKCRHINYDRLDAFLCVECGYCSSGTFSYEIAACPASRAVAITDDEGLERAVRMMWVAGNKHNEYKGVLLKTLQNSKLSGQKRRRASDIDASINRLNGPLKRALLGDLPKVNFKNSSGNNNNGRKRRLMSGENVDRVEPSSGGSSAANRARSLLNLAIQLRSESGTEERASLGDVPDSLSRLVANIARVRNGSNVGRRNRDEENNDKRDSGDGSDAEGKGEESPKKILQNCEKIYRQMREVERDSFEFRRRVIAWKRLNQDGLANYGREVSITNCCYNVSSCSYCSQTILQHLLALVHVLFKERNATLSETGLNKEFISLLFNEGSKNDNTDLNRLKRAMIVALATKSTLGSDMIFTELQTRLQGSRCVICADILGELLMKDVKIPTKFVELAMQTLK